MADEEREIQPRGSIWLLVILVLLTFAVALIYFERQNPELAYFNQAQINNRLKDNRPTKVYVVYYNTGVFSPTNLRIHIGDSVKFQNDSDLPIRILSDDSDGIPDLVGFDSVSFIPTQSAFTYTFSKVGTFGYHLEENRTERGTVIVRP